MMKNRKDIVKIWLGMLLVCSLWGGCSEDGELILVGSNAETEMSAVEDEITGAEVSATLEEIGGTEGAEGLTCEDKAGEAGLFQVYVCGAVKEPGVVKVAPGSRIEAALEAAGGFAGNAAEDGVNLADWVADGQMLYFPTEEEQLLKRAEEAAQEAGLVNINTADVRELCTLAGIGESRAADIIAYREKHGGFGSCEEIMQVTGIKESVFEKIRDRIVVK